MSIICHAINAEGETPDYLNLDEGGVQFWLSRALTEAEEKELDAKFPKGVDYDVDKDAIEFENGKLGDMVSVNADMEFALSVKDFLHSLEK